MSAVLPIDDAQSLVRRMLLEPAGLDDAALQQVLATLNAHALDFGELYFQWSRDESWSLEDGIVKDASHSIDRGVGVRALSGERAGLAYSDDIELPALLEAARAARAVARQGGSASVPSLTRKR